MIYTVEEREATQRVVDHVAADWDGATVETVEERLRAALSEAGVDLQGADIKALAEAITAAEGRVDATAVMPQ